jgi:peptidoglycan/LPS O-acetylase OafA/YrhL
MQPTHAPADIKAITSLRFFAAFAVLVLHYRDMFGPLEPWVLRGIVGGQYGVTFFFILSGFILTYRYQDWFEGGVQAGDYWRFQRFRFARIYPIYLLGLLMDTPWHLWERGHAGAFAGQGQGQMFLASWLLNLLGLQAWIPSVPFAMFWNTPAWSVAAEFFFYAIFPFVCAWLCRWKPGQRTLVAFYLAVLAGGIAMYAAVIHVLTYVMPVADETRYIAMVYNPVLRYSEFLCGCLAGRWFVQSLHDAPGFGLGVFKRQGWRNLAIVLALALVAARVWSSDYTGPSAELWLLDVSAKYGAYIVPFTVLILACASGRTFLSPLLERSWMVTLGEASYALYIIHWSFLSFQWMGFLGEYNTTTAHVLMLLATVGASVLCYRFIEVPARRRLRGQRREDAASSALTGHSPAAVPSSA